jgi:hypothetical protein
MYIELSAFLREFEELNNQAIQTAFYVGGLFSIIVLALSL